MLHAVVEVNTLSQKSYSIEALELLRDDIFYHKNSKRILSTHILFKILAGRYLNCDFCKVKQITLGSEMAKFGYKGNLSARHIKRLKSILVQAGLIISEREHNRSSYSYELTHLGKEAYEYFITQEKKLPLKSIKMSPQTEKMSPQINSQTPMIPGVSEKNVPSIYPYPYLISNNNIRSNAEPKVSSPIPALVASSKSGPRSSSSVFDFKRLGKYGFGRLQDRQLNSLGLDAKVVQDSINTFADAMERNSRFEKSIVCKIRYFMAMMRRDGCFAKLPSKETIKEVKPVDVEARRMIDYTLANGDGRYDDELEKLGPLKANPDEVRASIANFLKKASLNLPTISVDN